MKSFVRNALLGAAGLVALSLSAHAAGSTAVTDTPLFKSAPTTSAMQLAQLPIQEPGRRRLQEVEEEGEEEEDKVEPRSASAAPSA